MSTSLNEPRLMYAYGDHYAHVIAWREHLAMQAIREAQPRRLSKAQALRFISQPLNLGRPVIKTTAWVVDSDGKLAIIDRAGRPGRPVMRTVYDDAHERRRDLLRRLEKLPKLGKASGWLANEEFVRVLDEVIADPEVKAHKRATEVERRLPRGLATKVARRTIERHLAARAVKRSN